MNYAVYNPTTNQVLTWVTNATGSIPEGFEFRLEHEVPKNAEREMGQIISQPAPEEVPMWALKEVCVLRNHMASIDAALVSLPEPLRVKATLRWEYKDTISRGSSMISALQSILGWSDAYVDELFVAADALSKS